MLLTEWQLRQYLLFKVPVWVWYLDYGDEGGKPRTNRAFYVVKGEGDTVIFDDGSSFGNDFDFIGNPDAECAAYGGEGLFKVFRAVHANHEEKDFVRVSGNLVCKICGMLYRLHPQPTKQCLTMHILCDGRWVKT